MCGIAGYWGAQPPDDAAVHGALELMRRRGPDHRQCFGAETQPGVSVRLLHSRLSIIDLDPRSNQPFTIGDTTLVFNGEIYNYLELRQRLLAQGVALRTDSDTEVLLQYYRLYGEACLEHFEGMWSFAIFDAARQSLFLARDRFGEKPLYVMRAGHGLYFGSEVKLLAALAGSWPQVDTGQLRRYLALGYKCLHKTERTFFTGVEQLPHAHCLTLSAANGDSGCNARPRPYWTPAPRQNPGMSMEEAVCGVRERLIQSMRLRVRADVPLALCLSGGVDSASLASIAVKHCGCELVTFSITDEDERYNEEANILATVRDLGCRHHLHPISRRGSLARLRDLVDYHDGPLTTATYYSHSLILEAVQQGGYRVTFSGAAADELFTGYYDHFLLHLAAVHGTPDHAEALESWRRHILGLVRNPLLRDPELYVRRPDYREHMYDGRAELAAFMTEPCDEPFFEEAYTAEPLRNRMLNELFHEATPVFLHEDDLNSMRCSVENRSPFLDTALFEFANAIPSRHLIRDGYGKYVLRSAMKGILNDTVRLDRQKKGFNTSVDSIVDLRDPAVRDYLLDPSARIFELVRREPVAELMARSPLPNHLSKFLFSFMNARIFLELFG